MDSYNFLLSFIIIIPFIIITLKIIHRMLILLTYLQHLHVQIILGIFQCILLFELIMKNIMLFYLNC